MAVDWTEVVRDTQRAARKERKKARRKKSGKKKGGEKVETVAGVPKDEVERVNRRATKPKAKPKKKSPAFDPDLSSQSDFKAQRKKARRKARKARRKVPDKPEPTKGAPPRKTPTAFTRYKGGREPVRKVLKKSGTSEKRFERDLRKQGRDEDTKILGFNIEAELEGRGGLADAGSWAKDVISKGAKANRQARKNLGLSGNTKVGPVPVASTTGGLSTGGERVAKDLVEVATNAPAAAYMVGAGVKEAAEGRPERLKRFGKGIKEHSPVALAAQGRFDEAGEEAKKHPGFTALEVTGVGGAVSRGSGAAVRGSGRALRRAPSKKARKAGKKLRQAGSTKRAPRGVPGTNIREERTYSPGLVGKAGQVATERMQHGRSQRARKKAKRAAREGQHGRARELRAKAVDLDPRLLPLSGIGKRVDERVHLAEVRRRAHRSDALQAAEQALPKGGADIALLIAQGVVKPTRDSLRSYLKKIDGQIRSGNLTKAETQAAKRLRKQLADALADKSLDLAALKKVATEYAKVVNPRQKGLMDRGVLGKEAEIAKLVPYAVREMGARFQHGKSNAEGRLIGKGGKEIGVGDIKAHMRRNGIDPDDIAYVTQAPGQRGARNFFVNWQDPKGVPSKRRTGEATRKGTFEVNREVGRENVARMQGLQDAFDEYAGFVKEVGYRSKGKKVRRFETRRAAEDFIRNLDSPYEWRPVPVRPQFGRKAHSEGLLAKADEDVMTGPVKEAIEDALAGKGEGGKWVLVPAQAAERMAQHSRLLGSKEIKFWRGKIGKQFSATVLTTSGIATWPMGNAIEGLVRAAVLRAGPASYALGRKTIKELRELDPGLARELEIRLGHGQFGAHQMNAIHATAQAFTGTKFAPVSRALGTLLRTPGPKQVANLWDSYSKFVFGTNMRLIEEQLKVAMFGKYLSRSGRGKRDWRNGSATLAKAAEQAARGMKGTNDQVAAARFVRRAYGQYEAWSPSARFTIAVFTPFAAWAANATKFLLDVLPRDHPVATGLMASSVRASEEWRNEMGLGFNAPGRADSWLQVAIPIGRDENGEVKLLQIGRYTPAALVADFPEGVANLVVPQVSGALQAARGDDWKGDPLGGADRSDDVGTGERLGGIGSALAGSFIPFFALSQRMNDKGVVEGLNPLRTYTHNPELSAAFDQRTEVDKQLKELRSQQHPQGGGRIDAENPTPEYSRLLAKRRKAEAQIHKLSKGEYGRKPAGGSGLDAFRGGGSSGSALDEFRGSSSGSALDEFRSSDSSSGALDAFR